MDILLVFCDCLSCFIINVILFQFMGSRYKKNFHNRYLYAFIQVAVVILMSCMNLLGISILNLVAWCLTVAASSYFLYYEVVDRPLRRILECEVLLLCMSVCEALGVFLLQCGLQAAGIGEMDAVMQKCVETVFSKIVVIFLYYLVINRMMRKQNIPHAKIQYSIYAVMLAYSLINMLVAVEIFSNGKVSYLCVTNMACIVLVDLYLLHFANVEDERNYYENQVKVLEQQASVQYEYYLAMGKKCDQSVHILHDVKKHIQMIHELYQSDQGKLADEYVNGIADMLSPLVPVDYTGNPILNILLTDKEMSMKEAGISVDMEIDHVNLDFLDPMDATTIFGNLLDNAMEGTKKAEGEKHIFIKLASYHQMVVARIENSCGDVKWKNGLPISEKGEGRGIGLLNVRGSIEKYDGDLQLRQEQNRFVVELFLNS